MLDCTSVPANLYNSFYCDGCKEIDVENAYANWIHDVLTLDISATDYQPRMLVACKVYIGVPWEYIALLWSYLNPKPLSLALT